MKKARKLVSLLLVLAMIFGVVACGKDSDSKKKKSKKTEKVSVSDDDDVDPSIQELIDEPALAPAEDIQINTNMGVKIAIDSTLAIPEDAEFEVTQMEEVVDPEIGAHYTEYDITLGDVHELDGYIEIRLPYNEANIPAGQDPEQCVAAMYLNDETGEWESVLYDVDTSTKEVVIYTDHFSVYGCFEFENEGKRCARVTKVSDAVLDMDLETIQKVLAEYDRDWETGIECRAVVKPYIEETFKAIVEKTGTASDYADGVITNLMNMAGGDMWTEQYPKFKDLPECMGRAGLYCSIAAFTIHINKADKTNEDILKLYKEAAYVMASAAGVSMPYVGSIAAAVWVVDIVIEEAYDYVVSSVYEDEMKAYRYYMKSDEYGHKPLDRKEWRKIIYDTAKAAITDPVTLLPRQNFDAGEEIMKKIDEYCNEYWTLPIETQKSINLLVDQKGRWNPTEDMKKSISETYKKELLEELTGVFNAVEVQLQMEAKAVALKELNNLKKFFNQVSTIKIQEKIPAGQTSYYAGFTAAFSPLADIAVKSDWQITLDDKGCATIPMTFASYILVGEPKEIRFYPPGTDPGDPSAVPALVKPWTINDELVEIEYTGMNLENLLGSYQGTMTITNVEVTQEWFDYTKQSYKDQVENGDSSVSTDMENLTKPECDQALMAQLQEEGRTVYSITNMTISSSDPKTGVCDVVLTVLSPDGSGTNDVNLIASYMDGVFTFSGSVPDVQQAIKMFGGSGSSNIKDMRFDGVIRAEEVNGNIVLNGEGIVISIYVADPDMHAEDITISISATKNP